jgi:hypothetical protein
MFEDFDNENTEVEKKYEDFDNENTEVEEKNESDGQTESDTSIKSKRTYTKIDWEEMRRILSDPSIKGDNQREKQRFERYRRDYLIDEKREIVKIKGNLKVIENKEKQIEIVNRMHTSIMKHASRDYMMSQLAKNFFWEGLKNTCSYVVFVI